VEKRFLTPFLSIVSPRGCLIFLVRRIWERNGPVERTGGGEGAGAKGVGGRRHVNHPIQGEAPGGARESPGPARNDVVLHNMNMGGGPRVGEYRLSVPDKLRREAIAVGCLERKMPGRAPGGDDDRNPPLHRKATQVGEG
jgi:hypothetical protein